MTEAEWQESEDPARMLKFLQNATASERKVRLFICACWRPRIKVVAEPRALLRDVELVEAGRYDRSVPMHFFPTYVDYWLAARSSSEVGINAAKKKRRPE